MKDPGGKIELQFQPVQVMSAKECWQKAKSLVEMLHTCDIGWEPGSKQWLMKRTPAYFLRDAIVLRVVVSTIKDARSVSKAMESWTYDSIQAEVIMKQNDFHILSKRPLPLDACMRFWVFVGVLTRTVLVEVQVHLAALWNPRQDAALPIELLEGRMDHPWVTEWQEAAKDVADAVVDIHKGEQNEARRHEQRLEAAAQAEAKREAEMQAAENFGSEVFAAKEAAMEDDFLSSYDNRGDSRSSKR